MADKEGKSYFSVTSVTAYIGLIAAILGLVTGVLNFPGKQSEEKKVLPHEKVITKSKDGVDIPVCDQTDEEVFKLYAQPNDGRPIYVYDEVFCNTKISKTDSFLFEIPASNADSISIRYHFESQWSNTPKDMSLTLEKSVDKFVGRVTVPNVQSGSGDLLFWWIDLKNSNGTTTVPQQYVNLE